MAYIQKCATGPNVALSQKLLGEIAAARITLLNAEKRAAYDTQLRLDLGLPAAAEGAASPDDGQSAAAAPRPAQLSEMLARIAPALTQLGQHPLWAGRRRVWAVSGAVLLLAGCVILAWVSSGPDAEIAGPPSELTLPSSTADGSGAPELNPPAMDPGRPEPDPVMAETKPEPTVTPPKAKPRPKAPETVAATPPPPAPVVTTPPPAAPPKVMTKPPEPVPPPAVVEKKPERLPPPDPEAIAQAKSRIEAKYQSEFDQANRSKTLADKDGFALKLLERAGQASDDAASRFVLLKQACDFAARGGTVATSLKCLAELEKQFQVDALTEKAELLETLDKSAKMPAEFRSTASEAFKLVDEAFARGDYPTMKSLLTTASDCARSNKGDDKALSKSIAEWKKEHSEPLKEWEEVQKWEAELRRAPENPDASLKFGRYLCLVLNQWDEGLPKLAQAGNPALAAIAERETARPSEPEAQADLGEAWWQAAESAEGPWRDRMRSRAGYWFRRAFVRLPLAAKLKAESRLESLDLAGDQGILAKDAHLGFAGTRIANNIYVLRSPRSVRVSPTTLQFQAHGPDENTETQGTILLSLDGQHWIPVGNWTPESRAAAKKQNGWQELPLTKVANQTRALEIQVRFDSAGGKHQLTIEQVVWLP
jgi:outer membrane biosynthesis protein TonB